MRSLVTLATVAACGSSMPDDHVLHNRSEAKTDAARIHYLGTAVPLRDIPIVGESLGLPVSGTTDVLIDITIPIRSGERDYRHATGTIEVRCTACTIGDDVAKLKVQTQSKQPVWLLDEGVLFGHLTFDKLEARFEIEHGRVGLVHWVAESPDVVVKLELSIDLAQAFERSTLDGCVRYRPTAALRQRDPKMSALIELIGGARGEDGFDHVRITGDVTNRKSLPSTCGVR